MRLAFPLLIALASSHAIADEQTGFYLGGQLGEARYHDTGFLSGNTETSHRVYAGYRFLENLGIEVGYADFGTASRTVLVVDGDLAPGLYNYGTSLDGITLGLNGTLPIGERWLLQGRAGAFAASADSAFVGPGGYLRINDSDSTDWYAGVGGGYKLANGLRLTAGVDRYEAKASSVEYLSTGLEYQF